MASNTDSIVSQSHPVPSNEIVAPSHGSHQQHVRQGNDYQNVTVAEGGRAILGNVYADNFSMSILDPSQRPQKMEEEKRQEYLYLAVLPGGVPDMARSRIQSRAPWVPVDQGKAWCGQVDSDEMCSASCTES
jgi:hypothetical protein